MVLSTVLLAKNAMMPTQRITTPVEMIAHCHLVMMEVEIPTSNATTATQLRVMAAVLIARWNAEMVRPICSSNATTATVSMATDAVPTVAMNRAVTEYRSCLKHAMRVAVVCRIVLPTATPTALLPYVAMALPIALQTRSVMTVTTETVTVVMLTAKLSFSEPQCALLL